jgi:transposase InsO family protein
MPDSDSDSGDEKSSSSPYRFPILSESSYGEWKGRMQDELECKELFSYVTGERQRPALPPPPVGPEDADAAAARERADAKCQKWKDKDNKAKGMIAQRLPSDHRHLKTAASSSRALWDSIVQKYEHDRSAASIATTVVQVANKRWVDGSLEKHISWFRETNQRLAQSEVSNGADPTELNHFPQRILSCLLVNSIPSVGDWGAVKASIFTNGALKFEQVAAQLLGEAHRLKLDESSRQSAPTPMSAAAHYSSRGRPEPAAAPWQTAGGEKPTCSYCNKRGHTQEKCWQRYPDQAPDHWKQRRSQSKTQSDRGKRAGQKSRSGRGEGQAGSAQQHEDDDEGQSPRSPRWAHCAVTTEEDEDDVTMAPPASVPASVPASLSASEPTDAKVSVYSVGIKGKSLVTDWLVDSGASLHYCHQREMFDSFEAVTGKGRWVILGDGRRIPVAGYGTLRMSVPVFGGLNAATLTNVQFTPDMAVNLLSVPSLTEAGMEVRFLGRDCTIRQGRKVIARARKVANNLFQLTMAKTVTVAVTAPHTAGIRGSHDGSAHVTQADLAQLWHQRLGHTNFASLTRLFGKEQVKDESTIDYGQITRALRGVASKCEACALAKSTRQPFPTDGATRARNPLELIHMDLGFMPERSTEGAKYFLTIQDDCTRKCWAVLLKSKSDVLRQYKTWVVAAEATHSVAGHKVLAVRSDNGGEFINREFDALLAERGTRRERSAAYTPEQNGVAERVNRTLLDSVRAMLHDSQLGDAFWGEALLTAVYIHNRVSHRALNSRTPYEAWSGHKPGVGHMRAFGSLAFAHVPKVGRNKLALRARRCVFLGYEPDAKVYRLWDLSANRIIVSRDVDFWEGVSWKSEAAGRGGAAPVAAETKVTAPSSSSTRRSNPRRAVRGDDDSEVVASDDDTSDDDSEPASPQPVADDEAAAPEPASPVSEAAVDDEKEPAEEADSPAAAQPRRRRGRMARSDPGYIPHDLAVLRDRNSPAAGDIAPSLVAPRAMATSDDVEQDPRSYKEAMRSAHAREWRTECKGEMSQQHEMGTYELVPRPRQRVNVVDNKWVFRSKYNAEGELVKRKARLVAKGYSQRPGVDFFETYSPVVRYPSMRALLSMAAQHDWEVHHMDVKAAFLNGDLQETVYMRQPEGFEVKGKEDWVCLLKKGVYGLRQGSRVWNEKAAKLLRRMCFTPLEADECVFVYRSEGRLAIVALYVDDMFLFVPRGSDLLAKLKVRLQKEFEMTDLGEVSEALGAEFTRDRKARTLTITQRRHVRGILERAGMTDCAAATTPLAAGTQLCLPEEGYKATAGDTLRYQKAMGELNYLVSWARPDIAFAVSALSKYCANPSPQHFAGLRHLYRYLRGTQEQGITYRGAGDIETPPTLSIYSDADFAACTDDRRSVTGYSVHMGGAAISWLSTRQSTTAQSTVEAEYMASAEAVKEAIWWRAFLRGLGRRLNAPTVLYSDNQGSIALSKNPDSHRRTKHIDVRFHLIREHVKKRTVVLQYVSTSEMPADALTKSLPPHKHRHCAALLGMGA